MWAPKIWLLSGLLVSTAVAVAATPAQAADNYMLGTCTVSQPDSGAEIRPTYAGNDYLYSYHAGDPRYQGFTFNDNKAKVTLVKAPAHGKVERENSEISNNYYRYMPKEGYFGKDNFVMQVEKNGVRVKIHYTMETPDGPTTYIGDDGEQRGHYCNPGSWKISSTTPPLDNARAQALLGATNPQYADKLKTIIST